MNQCTQTQTDAMYLRPSGSLRLSVQSLARKTLTAVPSNCGRGSGGTIPTSPLRKARDLVRRPSALEVPYAACLRANLATTGGECKIGKCLPT